MAGTTSPKHPLQIQVLNTLTLLSSRIHGKPGPLLPVLDMGQNP